MKEKTKDKVTIMDESVDLDKIVDELDEETINEINEKTSAETEKILNNVDEMEIFLQKLEKKFQVIPMAGTALSYVPIMISLVRNYVKKEYNDIPISSIGAIVAALLYVLLPFDAISDFLGPFGLADDAAVVTGCLAVVKTDIEDYKKWRKKNGYEVDDLPDYEDIAEGAKENKKFVEAFFSGKKSATKKTK